MVHRVVLHVHLGDAQLPGQPLRAHERREARVEPGLRRLHRQQFQVAPERGRPALDERAADHLLDRGVVVRHLERAETLAAHPRRGGRVLLPAQMTRQPRNESHFLISRTRRRPHARCWPRDALQRVMHRQRPHHGLVAGAGVHRGQQLFQPLEILPRDDGNRRTGARQERPEHVGILEREHVGQQRHHRRARRLVPAIAHALAEPLVVPRLQGVHERQHALHVEDGVAPVQVIRQRRAGLRGGQAHRRRRHDQPQLIGPGPVQRFGRMPFVGNHRRQAAEERRRRVVGVPFERGGRRQQFAVRQRVRHFFEQAQARPPWPRRCCPARPPSGCRSPPRRARSAS